MLADADIIYLPLGNPLALVRARKIQREREREKGHAREYLDLWREKRRALKKKKERRTSELLRDSKEKKSARV